MGSSSVQGYSMVLGFGEGYSSPMVRVTLHFGLIPGEILARISTELDFKFA